MAKELLTATTTTTSSAISRKSSTSTTTAATSSSSSLSSATTNSKEHHLCANITSSLLNKSPYQKHLQSNDMFIDMIKMLLWEAVSGSWSIVIIIIIHSANNNTRPIISSCSSVILKKPEARENQVVLVAAATTTAASYSADPCLLLIDQVILGVILFIIIVGASNYNGSVRNCIKSNYVTCPLPECYQLLGVTNSGETTESQVDLLDCQKKRDIKEIIAKAAVPQEWMPLYTPTKSFNSLMTTTNGQTIEESLAVLLQCLMQMVKSIS